MVLCSVIGREKFLIVYLEPVLGNFFPERELSSGCKKTKIVISEPYIKVIYLL